MPKIEQAPDCVCYSQRLALLISITLSIITQVLGVLQGKTKGRYNI